MNKRVLISKLIYLSVVAVSIIIVVIAIYANGLSKNKVNKDNIFDYSTLVTDGMVKVSEDDFLDYFSSFDVTATEYINAYKGSDGIVNGHAKFKVTATLKDETNYSGSTFTIRFCLGASVIGYKSDESSSTTVTSGSANSNSTISSISQIFPANGKLLFTSVKNPTLYAFVTFSRTVNDTTESCYSVLSFSYNEFIK